MAGVSDYFSIGSTVACKTCYDKEIEGEVLAFDQQTKMLILKCPSSCGRSSLNDVHIVNLSLVSDVQVKKEVSPTTSEPPQSLNLQRLNTRMRNSIDAKRMIVKALQAGVSPEGQSLFIAISKTIPETTWHGPTIVVFDNIHIKPPYKVENVQGPAGNKAFMHVKKIVEKHMADTAAAELKKKEQTGPSQQTQKSSSTEQEM